MARREDAPAREILDVVPAVMRFIRAEMRGHRGPDLSVPQFRSLVYIEKAGGPSLNGVADHLGLTPPSASKLVDGLAARGLVTRREAADDRRRITLEITPAGARGVAEARAEAQRSLSGMLAGLDDEELGCVIRAMAALRRVFSAEAGERTASNGNR